MIKAERIKSDIKRALSEVLSRLGYTSVNFVKLSLTSDLKYLKVEINSIKKEENSIDLVKKLNKNIHKIVFLLHKFLRLKNFPKILFCQDSHAERIKNIIKIIESV